MSTIGEKVSGAANTVTQFAVNPATAAQVVGRDAIALLIDRAMTLGDPRNDSLIAFSQAARVEPTCLVDTDVLFIDELHDVLQTLQSIFAGYYLQAIQLDTVYGNMRVIDTLEKFNPSRNMHHAVGKAATGVANTVGHAFAVHQAGHGIGPGPNMQAFSMEAFADALPDYSIVDDIALEAETGKKIRKVDPAFDSDQSFKNWRQHRELTRASQQDQQHRDRLKSQRTKQELDDYRQGQADEDRARRLELEHAREQDRKADRHAQHARQNKLDEERSQDRAQAQADRAARDQKEAQEAAAREAEARRVVTSYGSDALKEIKEVSKLAVGKMIDVEIKHNGQVFQVPVAIRLLVNSIPSAQLVHILSLATAVDGTPRTATARWHAFSAGRLSFVKDLIFCKDLIDEHRRTMMKAGDSVYKNMVKREQRNVAAALLGGTPSIAAASNLVVCSQRTIEEIEMSMPGKFSDFHARQKVFEETSIMIIAVINPEWANVTFYHRGLPDPTEVSFRSLKAGSGKDGPDVSDILKAYTLGNSPRL